ncbi:MAG TPA: hypothetical protein VHO29_08905 [Marmoricola sp.]|nr:hypothetical protein [Marmoricola sp.]
MTVAHDHDEQFDLALRVRFEARLDEQGRVHRTEAQPLLDHIETSGDAISWG